VKASDFVFVGDRGEHAFRINDIVAFWEEPDAVVVILKSVGAPIRFKDLSYVELQSELLKSCC